MTYKELTVNKKTKLGVGLGLTLALSLVLSGCGTIKLGSNEEANIKGNVITTANITNMAEYDTTGNHLLIYDKLYAEILNSYTTDKNIKKEVNANYVAEGVTNPFVEAGQEEYNSSYTNKKLNELSLEMLVDLYDISDAEIYKDYDKHKKFTKLISVTLDTKYFEKNPKQFNAIKKKIANIKTESDLANVETTINNTEKGYLDSIYYNDVSIKDYTKDQQALINSIPEDKVTEEKTTSEEGFTYLYKKIGVADYTKDEYRTFYLNRYATNKNLGSLDKIMEEFNKKKNSDVVFKESLIKQIKEEYKILSDIAQKEQEASENAVEESSEEESESEVKANEQKVKADIDSGKTTNIEDEVNTFSK